MGNENEAKHGTVFDDVFRTMAQKLPRLLVAVINEAFGTNYSEETAFEQLRNEHYEKNGMIVTDSILRIRNHIYHIECQSTEDKTMVIRMIEYDFAIALEQARTDGTPYEVRLPESCVLYLRDEPKAPDTLTLNVRLPDGQCFTYQAKAVRIPRYSLDEIFEKRLFFFLPYYIMRYEKELDLIERDNDRLEELEAEFLSIRKKLEILTDEEKVGIYRDILAMIKKISDYVLREQKQTREGVENIVGGQILELPSDKLKQEHARGVSEGVEVGRAEGINQEQHDRIVTMLRKGKTPGEIADFCDYPLSLVTEIQESLLAEVF